jgi:hypothetical protein
MITPYFNIISVLFDHLNHLNIIDHGIGNTAAGFLNSQALKILNGLQRMLSLIASRGEMMCSYSNSQRFLSKFENS